MGFLPWLADMAVSASTYSYYVLWFRRLWVREAGKNEVISIERKDKIEADFPLVNVKITLVVIVCRF